MGSGRLDGPSTEVDARTIGLTVCAAGAVHSVPRFVEAAHVEGFRVAVTATPTAGDWLARAGLIEQLEATTGLPVRTASRMPGEPRPHPPLDVLVIAPASANTVAKLALGIADNDALSTAVEAVGISAIPVIVFPRVNAAHTRHPAWRGHMSTLRAAGVHVVEGDDVWPLLEPRTEPADRPLPWDPILRLVDELVG